MRLFTAKDLEELNSWYAARELAPVRVSSLPQFGLIEPGVVAGFLYLTDSDIALIDGIITNPEAFSEVRNAALDELLTRLGVAAKDLGVRCLIGLCKDIGIARRSIERHGGKSIGIYEMAVKEL